MHEARIFFREALVARGGVHELPIPEHESVVDGAHAIDEIPTVFVEERMLRVHSVVDARIVARAA